MKITNIDSFIEEFRNGRDIWSRTTVELAMREIERLRKRIAELEQERNNKCSDCCYVNPILDFWKNDTEYDDLPQPPNDGE